MELETVRIFADWLQDPTNGVNALLPTTPRDAGDVQPPAFPNGSICDSTRHGWVARRAFGHDTPATLPALAVFAESIIMDGDVETVLRDAQGQLIIGYCMNKSATEQGTRDALYTLRTVIRSIRQLEQPANADSRLRNSVRLIAIERITQKILFTPWGDGLLVAGVACDLNIRDLAP